MSDIIHLLPDTVANQIAAGEVIQRPASVIKELVENSIDAGATCINVIVIDAGKTCIQVIDDGKGMSETDARLSFERHATSKIREAADLFNLHTMGFRGEALASIAAVAQVELRTRQHDAELGTSITIEGGSVIGQEPISCAQGSNFIVKNLFFNVPARRKFLKTNQTELSNIIAEFEKIALVHPEVTFTLNSAENELYNLQQSSLRQRIINIFGKKLNQNLLSLEADTSLVRITGFIGKPDSAKKKGANQFFFVNNRYMRHPYFNKAVQNSFEQLIPTGEQVPYFIYFDVDPSRIDVNIHPTKTEIKFEDEHAIWQILTAAIKESLGKYNAVPTIDFDTADRPDIPVMSSSEGSGDVPEASFDPTYNPFDSIPSERAVSYSAPYRTSHQQKTDTNWEQFYRTTTPEETPLDMIPSTDNPDLTFYYSADNVNTEETPAEEERSNVHYQFKGRFILTAVSSGLMVIDQHRAHKHILYNRYIQQIDNGHGSSQGLLFPEMIQLPISQVPLLEKMLDDLTSIGFEISNLGGGSYAVSGIPSGMEGLKATKLLQDIIDAVSSGETNASEDIKKKIALSLASSAAIVTGQFLGNEEMEEIINNLLTCQSPTYTEDGQLIFSIVKQENIEKLFR